MMPGVTTFPVVPIVLAPFGFTGISAGEADYA